MVTTILFFLHYLVLLLFGINLSFSFAKIQFTTKNFKVFCVFSTICGLIQLLFYLVVQEHVTWQVYPLLTHIPTIILLCKFYQKKTATAIAAVTTAYLCCQPANIIGIIVLDLTQNEAAEYIVRILVFCIVNFILRRYCKEPFAEIFTQDNRRVYTFTLVPMGYYIYDYTMGIYTEFWYTNNPIARELLPFFLFSIFMLLGITYYREYTLREASERKEQIIATTAEQQRRELETFQQTHTEIRLIRHDMRHILDSVAACIDNQDYDKALSLLSQYSSHVERTRFERYCENDTINYTLISFADKCAQNHITFSHKTEIGEIQYDEVLITSILSNALDNALNAQLELPESRRKISLMIAHSDDKLLISVKNPFFTKPVFRDGLPVARHKGHGYGTKSIQYITEHLGGNCQFTVQDDLFILRIIL